MMQHLVGDNIIRLLKTISRSNRLITYLKGNPFLIKRLGFGNGFHGDIIRREFIIEAISHFNASSFIETGTYYGNTSHLMAVMCPNLKLYTCEINKKYFESSKKRLKRFKNITIANQSSEIFIANLIENENIGRLPFFYLDAHWNNYWPLEDEINIITSKLEQSIIFIDDFQVPGRDDFKMEIASDGRICNFDLIQSKLNCKDEYHILYPSYTENKAFPFWKTNWHFYGYIVIFQNLKHEFHEFMRKEFLMRNYKEYTIEVGSNIYDEHTK